MTTSSTPREVSADGRGRRIDFAVLGALVLWILLLYGRALAIGVFSDGWVLLEIGSKGFLTAPTILLSYHTIPVANLLSAFLWFLFGLHTRAYQAANLAELALVAWCLYRLGVRVLGDRRIAALAGVLFAANAGFHEVVLWPMVGNFQSLAALLYLGALGAALRVRDGVRPWLWSAMFALAAVAAFFTYEPTLSVLVAGPLALLLVPRGDGPPPAPTRRVVVALAAAVLGCALVVGGSKLAATLAGYRAAFLPTDLDSAADHLFYILRALASVFSLRGSHDSLVRLMTLDVPALLLSRNRILLPATCMAIAGAATIAASRSRRAWFLGGWLAAHLAIVGLSTLLVSRMFYLAALPAALLEALALWRGAAWLVRRLAPAGRDVRVAALAALGAAVLVWGAAADRRTAIDLHLASSRTNEHLRAVTEAYLAARPQDPAPVPVLLNFRAAVAERGIGSMPWVNGSDALLRLLTKRWFAYERYHTYGAAPEGRFANQTGMLHLSRLFALARDRSRPFYLWQQDRRDFRRLEPAELTPPRAYTPESAPYLLWESQPEGAAVALIHGERLELPFAGGTIPEVVVVRVRTPANATFAIVDGRACAGDLPPATAGAPDGPETWTSLLLPLGPADPDSMATVSLTPSTDGWLAGASILPVPDAWTPERAPFLSWDRERTAFAVRRDITLPLDVSGGSPHLELRAASEPAILVDGEPAPLPPPGADGWRTLDVPARRSGAAVATIRVLPGGGPVLLRNVRAGATTLPRPSGAARP